MRGWDPKFSQRKKVIEYKYVEVFGFTVFIHVREFHHVYHTIWFCSPSYAGFCWGFSHAGPSQTGTHLSSWCHVTCGLINLAMRISWTERNASLMWRLLAVLIRPSHDLCWFVVTWDGLVGWHAGRVHQDSGRRPSRRDLQRCPWLKTASVSTTFPISTGKTVLDLELLMRHNLHTTSKARSASAIGSRFDWPWKDGWVQCGLLSWGFEKTIHAFETAVFVAVSFSKAAGSPDVPVVKEEVKSTPSIAKARALAPKHLSIYGRTYARITWFGNLRLRWKRREVSCQSRRGLWESGVKHTIEVANGFICKVCTWGETPRESCPTTTTCGGCGATEIRWLSGWEEMDDFSSTLTIPYHNNKHQSRKIFWPFGCRFPHAKCCKKWWIFPRRNRRRRLRSGALPSARNDFCWRLMIMVRQEALCRILVEDLFVSGSNWKMEHQNTLAFLFFFWMGFCDSKIPTYQTPKPKILLFFTEKKVRKYKSHFDGGFCTAARRCRRRNFVIHNIIHAWKPLKPAMQPKKRSGNLGEEEAPRFWRSMIGEHMHSYICNKRS